MGVRQGPQGEGPADHGIICYVMVDRHGWLIAAQAKGMVDEVMCTFVYPRLDVNVSIGVSQSRR